MIPLKSDIRVDHNVHLSFPSSHSSSAGAHSAPPSRSAGGYSHFSLALKALLMVPLFPLLGYWLLDQTGISQAMVTSGLIPKAILGEGFGHVGLCMSIHYLIQGGQSLVRAITCYFR